MLYSISGIKHVFHLTAFQMMKNHNDTVFVPEVPTIKESNQTTHDVIEPTPTAEETNSELSELMLSQKRIVLFKLNWKRSFAIRSRQ